MGGAQPCHESTWSPVGNSWEAGDVCAGPGGSHLLNGGLCGSWWSDEGPWDPLPRRGRRLSPDAQRHKWVVKMCAGHGLRKGNSDNFSGVVCSLPRAFLLTDSVGHTLPASGSSLRELERRWRGALRKWGMNLTVKIDQDLGEESRKSIQRLESKVSRGREAEDAGTGASLTGAKGVCGEQVCATRRS